MSNSTVLSINTLLNKAVKTLNLTSLSQEKPEKSLSGSSNGSSNNHEPDNLQTSHTEAETSANHKPLSIKDKVLHHNLMTTYQPHLLHYAMKGIGCLPELVLESWVGYLDGPTSKQYEHVDAHLRLILAVNSKLKTPLNLIEMGELRQRFATDAVAMQAPKVWQQASSTIFSSIKPCTNKDKNTVNWEDKMIANADDGNMIIRCYQKKATTTSFSFKTKPKRNPDQTVMLFFHGGGFCIGDVDTHHEFCHAVCEQTGWPIVSVDYRLAPEYPAPTALRDCIAAYAWLAENCQAFGALPSRIVLAGDSAGGGLSTMVAQQVITPTAEAWQDLGVDGQRTFEILQRLPQPMAQMPLYPVTDIENDYPSWELYGEGLLLDHADVAVFDAACLQNSPLPRQHILTSPMLGDNRQVCPTYIVAAELDVLRDQTFAYANQLEGYGIAVQTYMVYGAPHGFIHFMSIHQGLGQETHHIIDGFSSFVREIISIQDLLVA
ncbi:alpha/beta hydrolase [Psychrobacter sp. ANT_WB68]|uniref:alpha/beta hydrolase n=1 Tax=Psychrobacter sp. ANT_WB68 TaxID=2597355 RepID=UPI0011F3D605|nr:alpha/beta hydrolase [Psychrobacter sp. ANT_WB68]KAA0913381.1 alpha/beta hydrolase [Psychrobacter sp. ANT_WB68]